MNNNRLLERRKQVKYRLAGSANGVSLISTYRGNAKGGNVGKRGKVVGFSMASARRLRHLLFGVDYTDAVAVTLTHPLVMDCMKGPEAAFDALRKVRTRLPLRSLIWRKEVQASGTPHYHCILFPADGVEPAVAAEMLVDAWIHECVKGFDAMQCFKDGMRADMVKAHHDKRRPSIVVMDGSCYVRYILDHESKHKKEQSRTEGRAWGVWDRARLPRILPDDVELTDEEYWRLSRILRKATRYSLKCGCVFGWRHTKGRRARGVGVVDYFARMNDGGLAKQVMACVKADSKGGLCMEAGRFFRRQFEGVEHGEMFHVEHF